MIVDYLERVGCLLSRWLNWAAACALAAMMFLVCANVILRRFYRPILGTYEIVGFLGAAVISFGLAYTTVKKGHVAVELVVSRFSQRIQAVIGSITSFLSLALFALLAWRSVCYATNMSRAGELSQTLKIPFFPLVYGLAFACALVCLVVLVELFKSLAQAVKR